MENHLEIQKTRHQSYLLTKCQYATDTHTDNGSAAAIFTLAQMRPCRHALKMRDHRGTLNKHQTIEFSDKRQKFH